MRTRGGREKSLGWKEGRKEGTGGDGEPAEVGSLLVAPRRVYVCVCVLRTAAVPHVLLSSPPLPLPSSSSLLLLLPFFSLLP